MNNKSILFFTVLFLTDSLPLFIYYPSLDLVCQTSSSSLESGFESLGVASLALPW